jgi:hypothetical protein
LSQCRTLEIIFSEKEWSVFLKPGLSFSHFLITAAFSMLQGASNILGSFFSCLPFSASLSRSLIQQTVGGKTQLASVVSCLLLLLVLLLIGPFFEPLPNVSYINRSIFIIDTLPLFLAYFPLFEELMTGS